MRRLILAVLALAVIGAVVWLLRARDEDAPPAPGEQVEAEAPSRVAPEADHEAAHAGARTASGRATGPAQPSRGEEPRARIDRVTSTSAADALVERLAAKVALAPDLREALQQVLREEREAAAAIVEREADEEARAKALDQLRADTHAQVESLLSPEQLAAYRELRPR